LSPLRLERVLIVSPLKCHVATLRGTGIVQLAPEQPEAAFGVQSKYIEAVKERENSPTLELRPAPGLSLAESLVVVVVKVTE
jgi:hypothetical protein